MTSLSLCFCGRSGIQTPDTLKGYTGFRVQRDRSLCQPSNMYYIVADLADAKVIQNPDTTKRIIGNLRKLFKSKFLQAVSQLFRLTLADA